MYAPASTSNEISSIRATISKLITSRVVGGKTSLITSVCNTRGKK